MYCVLCIGLVISCNVGNDGKINSVIIQYQQGILTRIPWNGLKKKSLNKHAEWWHQRAEENFSIYNTEPIFSYLNSLFISNKKKYTENFQLVKWF